MQIRLSKVGKRFNREWIFRNVTLDLSLPSSYVLIGPNGSGKSTLLQTVGGLLQPSTGQVAYYVEGKQIAAEKAFQYISFCAPYMELIEEMTLVEFLHFHQSFKPWDRLFKVETIIEEIGLADAAQKQIRNFSSGMKQRVKLAQAIFSNAALLLLDEPCSNLDTNGVALYKYLMESYCKNKIVIVASNNPDEYEFICDQQIEIKNFKSA